VSVIGNPTPPLDEDALRVLVPRVLAGLVRRGEDFDAAEDALQEALLEALIHERSQEVSERRGVLLDQLESGGVITATGSHRHLLATSAEYADLMDAEELEESA